MQYQNEIEEQAERLARIYVEQNTEETWEQNGLCCAKVSAGYAVICSSWTDLEKHIKEIDGNG